MLKDMSVPGHRHSASDIVRGTLSPARLPNTVASQADLDDLSELVADLETDKADVVHTHDDRYYTETEVDALLADKSDATHLHDDRYYTESEADSLFEPAISDTGWTDVTVEAGWTVNTTVRVRRIGNVVHWRGRITPDAAKTGTQTPIAPGSVPEWARPGSIFDTIRPIASSHSSTDVDRRYKSAGVGTDGSVSVWYGGVANSDPAVLSGLTGYVVD